MLKSPPPIRDAAIIAIIKQDKTPDLTLNLSPFESPLSMAISKNIPDGVLEMMIVNGAKISHSEYENRKCIINKKTELFINGMNAILQGKKNGFGY